MRTPIFHTMNRMLKTTAILVGMVTVSFQAQAAEGLKTIQNPGGGQIVYGPMPGHPSLSSAMGMVLHKIHANFGERPQIGRLFQAHDSSSVATFFSVHAKSGDGRQITGMAIVTAPADADTAAAVVYDDAGRFGKTVGEMLKKLDQAWKTDTAASASSSLKRGSERIGERAAPAAAAKPLHTVTFPDNSGTIGIPEDWRITSAGAGAVHASGPDGATINLGVIFQNIYDPRSPRTAAMVRYMNMAHKPVYVYPYPYSGNLFTTYQALAAEVHKKMGLPTQTFHLIASHPTPASPYEGVAVMVLAEVDDHKGQGLMLSSMRLGAMKAQPGGQWAMTINEENVPRERVDEEWPTITAMVRSYNQNGAVLMQQADDIIAQIHATAAVNQKRMDDFQASNDARNRSIDQTRDDQNKYSKSFQNYQFDQTVVRDTETGGHGTFDYKTADFLVRNDPNHFEYVQTPDFLKGIDY